MNMKIVVAASVLLTSSTLWAQQSQNMDMNQMMQAVQSMMAANTNAAPTIDFRELKALLPADLPGMKRVNASGEKNSAMGITISHAIGEYQSDAGGSINIEFSDMGGMANNMLGMLQTSWTSVEIDRESDTGYEKTTELNGNKAYEKYDGEDKRGELQVIVNKRILVKLEGDNISMDELKAAIGKIDLAKLGELQPKAATP